MVALEALTGQSRPLDGGCAGGQVTLHTALRSPRQAGDRAHDSPGLPRRRHQTRSSSAARGRSSSRVCRSSVRPCASGPASAGRRSERGLHRGPAAADPWRPAAGEAVRSGSPAIDEIVAAATEEVRGARRGVELAQRLVTARAVGQAGLLCGKDDALATLGGAQGGPVAQGQHPRLGPWWPVFLGDRVEEAGRVVRLRCGDPDDLASGLSWRRDRAASSPKRARGTQRRTFCRAGGRCRDHPSRPPCRSGLHSLGEQGGSAGAASWRRPEGGCRIHVSERCATSPRMTPKWLPTASQVRPMVHFATPLGQGCVHRRATIPRGLARRFSCSETRRL